MAYSSNTPFFTPVVVNHIPMTLSSTPVYLSPHQLTVLIIKVQRTTLYTNKHIIPLYVCIHVSELCMSNLWRDKIQYLNNSKSHV